jgi:hypothetical protein
MDPISAASQQQIEYRSKHAEVVRQRWVADTLWHACCADDKGLDLPL